MRRTIAILGALLPVAILLLAANAADNRPAIAIRAPDPVAPTAVAEDATPAPVPEGQSPAPQTEVAAAAYAIDWYSINGGGATNQATTNYRLGSSIGQSVAGRTSSPNYKAGIGFWYGVPSAGGGCQCDCHADPSQCNGLQDVTDVVLVVNVSFRGAAAIPDPNPACPYERTDTNCSGSTDVVDVVKMVNVAFRGANPATEFCDPCP